MMANLATNKNSLKKPCDIHAILCVVDIRTDVGDVVSSLKFYETKFGLLNFHRCVQKYQ
jgi:hypothetical protein